MFEELLQFRPEQLMRLVTGLSLGTATGWLRIRPINAYYGSHSTRDKDGLRRFVILPLCGPYARERAAFAMGQRQLAVPHGISSQDQSLMWPQTATGGLDRDDGDSEWRSLQ